MITISQYATNKLNAGPKAKIDIERILKKEFKSKIYTLRLTGNEGNGSYITDFNYKIKKAIFAMKYLHGEDITIIQIPFINDTRFTKNLKNKIAFIHDLDGIRKQDKKIEKREINFLLSCNYIVAHNEKMKMYLIEKGIEKEKIYTLEMFDYLCEIKEKDIKAFDSSNVQVVYTGNLDKASFIKQLDSEKMNFRINVYGTKNDIIKNEKIQYKGKYKPDELPNYIEGDLGFVWDGNVDESDESIGFKNYTKYNNPHKLSCYLAAGIPVIVWEKSAVSEFITKYDVGYTINSIYDINEIDFSDYEIKRENAKRISDKVRSGFFTKNVIEKIIEKISL